MSRKKPVTVFNIPAPANPLDARLCAVARHAPVIADALSRAPEGHPDVKAARAWWYAVINQRVPHDEPMPATARAIWRRLNPVTVIVRHE